MRDLIQKIDNILKESVEEDNGLFQIGDEFGISFSEDLEIATTIVGFVEDGIVVELDEEAISIMESNGAKFVEGYLEEGLRDPADNPCWKGYKPVGTKKKNGKTVPNCVPKGSVAEGYRVVPGFDREKYQERPGLEGPFHTKSGKVVYYDKVEGKYYDPDTDMYIDYDDWQAMNEQGVAEGKKHTSPSGVETNMDPSDDDYAINYGKNGGVAKFRKSQGLDVKTGEKKVKEETQDPNFNVCARRGQRC